MSFSIMTDLGSLFYVVLLELGAKFGQNENGWLPKERNRQCVLGSIAGDALRFRETLEDALSVEYQSFFDRMSSIRVNRDRFGLAIKKNQTTLF